jgi:hypothetical protein
MYCLFLWNVISITVKNGKSYGNDEQRSENYRISYASESVLMLMKTELGVTSAVLCTDLLLSYESTPNRQDGCDSRRFWINCTKVRLF